MAELSLSIQRTGNIINVYASTPRESGEIVILVRLQRHIDYPRTAPGARSIWLNKAMEPGVSYLVHTEDLGSHDAGQRRVWVTGEYYEVNEIAKSESITM